MSQLNQNQSCLISKMCSICHCITDSELNPCHSCLDDLIERLTPIKQILKPDLMDKILQLGFCLLSKKDTLCELCNENNNKTKKHGMNDIHGLCTICIDEVMKRTIFIYDKSKTVDENLDIGLGCYQLFLKT